MKTRDEKKTAIILAGISSFLTFWLMFMYLRDNQQFIEHRLGVNPETFNNPIVWILTFVIAIGYIMYTARVIPFVRENLFTISWLKVIGIWIAIVSSTLEEILFRQILMDWLMSLDFSLTIQVLASAIIFGLGHSAWVLLGGDLKIALPAILATIALGGLLAILYIVADRNILAPIVAHVLINLFIEPWLILAVVTGNWKNTE
ncbi:CPBP family intramembrane metalloprotease [Salicibibacter cibarius]|uniref:CPBP family intramembrane metalloprotease n=1 Tax=Salicibibacter cibarius TaxID=2743000 RepID=A0A7T6Z3F2_9BACI|nr:CPBP family intramembrane glutamic endopeptidase [Salicibibacter cibarius]QQK76002.1 CPBP family intramembrane metalloprotease [Salicibibacter cibarius]